ncbi:unnamed protein product [Cuscuta campestris]|uniref:Uncharacterized protein n=1 Tax=Cuscuta campestris TaxID=132261 RepID=A0A484MAD5_9ASTE|nr:unnamed protein product [Cuscuta campestris]
MLIERYWHNYKERAKEIFREVFEEAMDFHQDEEPETVQEGNVDEEPETFREGNVGAEEAQEVQEEKTEQKAIFSFKCPFSGAWTGFTGYDPAPCCSRATLPRLGMSF